MDRQCQFNLLYLYMKWFHCCIASENWVCNSWQQEWIANCIVFMIENPHDFQYLDQRSLDVLYL